MGANTIGKEFSLTTFGESHGKAIGGIIDGCPASLTMDYDFITKELQRRKPQTEYCTDRKEDDKVIFLSGIENGITLGTPIGFMIENKDIRIADYKDVSRNNHADFTYFEKYGIAASSGGGRASARETAARVVGGSVAKLFLNTYGISINTSIETIGNINYVQHNKEANALLQQVKETNDTIGGKIKCNIKGCPAGLGEPVFDRFSSLLAGAVMSIPSVKTFEFGDGLSPSRRGSEYIGDGLQGGISNGKEIEFLVGFKPVPSFNIKGRHDICQLFRASVIVEAMAALVTADLIKRNFKINKI
ncbi:MAG: chorismate synthase [Bacteroidales bacterium]|jgi:chorismate synthase|nr:chorismate synthase [Bacteroidales bacterium]